MRSGIALGLLLALAPIGVAANGPSPASPEAVLRAAALEVEAGNAGPATEALLGLDTQVVPPPVRREVDLLLGLLLLKQGRGDEAVPRLERATMSYPLLADYALYGLAAAHRQGGRPDEAAKALRRLLDEHPKSLFLERAGRELPRDWLEAGDLSRAEEAAGRYLGVYPQAAGRAEVWVTLGEVLLKTGRAEKAEQVFRRVWVELPGSPDSQRARDLLAALPDARPFTADERFLRAATLYRLGRYAQALPELAPFAEATNPRAAQARLFLGIGAFRLRQYGRAAEWLEPLGAVAGPDQADVLHWLGRSFGRSGDAARFTEVMLRLADAFPQSRRGEEALYLLAQTAADDGEPAKGRAYLARLLQEYPAGAWRDTALWLQGWLAYKEQEPEAALVAWGRLLADEPGSRLRTPALYWRGRVLEATARPKEATAAYRAILATAQDQPYYRRLAVERLAGLGKAAPPATPAAAPARRAPKPVDALHARKARALRALGLAEEAAEEYSEQIRIAPEDRAGLAEACGAFLDLERFDRAVWLAARVLRPLYVQENGQPPIRGFWQCLYPLGHFSLVRDQVRAQGLDPFLVTALIREESAFAPQAVSGAGALGLMQLMPHTAVRVARDNRLPLENPPPLHAPEVNIRLGTLHLAELLREHGGNLALALAAYNAGKQPVQRWLERFGFGDEAAFIEDIPYSETRNYVKRILGTYERYKSLYGGRRADSREPTAERQEPRVRSGQESREPSTESREPRASSLEP